MFDALIRGDTNARAQALREHEPAISLDGRLWQNLGDLEFGRRNFKAALESLGEARRTVPEDTAIVNAMGYAKALSGDLAGATAILEEYRRRAPMMRTPSIRSGTSTSSPGISPKPRTLSGSPSMNPLLLAGGDLFRAALVPLLRGRPGRCGLAVRGLPAVHGR